MGMGSEERWAGRRSSLQRLPAWRSTDMSPNLPIDSMDRAPSHHKPAIPRASEIAARLASGEPIETIAAGCERTVATLRGHLAQRGYDSVTGRPLPPEWAVTKPPAEREWSFPAWSDQALCAEVEAELFFPVKGGANHGTVAEAKSICCGCPVTLECLEWALANDDQWG